MSRLGGGRLVFHRRRHDGQRASPALLYRARTLPSLVVGWEGETAPIPFFRITCNTRRRKRGWQPS